MFLDIIDRRKNPKGKSLANRRRYLKRHSKEVKEAVQEKINESNIKDIATETSKRVNIPIRETEEPVFHHDDGGVREHVLPGNKEYVQGDTIPRPQAGQGQGTEGSPDGEGEDDFAFELSQEEFLEYFFDGLELPDLVKKVLTGLFIIIGPVRRLFARNGNLSFCESSVKQT